MLLSRELKLKLSPPRLSLSQRRPRILPAPPVRPARNLQKSLLRESPLSKSRRVWQKIVATCLSYVQRAFAPPIPEFQAPQQFPRDFCFQKSAARLACVPFRSNASLLLPASAQVAAKCFRYLNQERIAYMPPVRVHGGAFCW